MKHGTSLPQCSRYAANTPTVPMAATKGRYLDSLSPSPPSHQCRIRHRLERSVEVEIDPVLIPWAEVDGCVLRTGFPVSRILGLTSLTRGGYITKGST